MAEPFDPIQDALKSFELSRPQRQVETPVAQAGIAGLGPSTADTAVTGDTEFARAQAAEQRGLAVPPTGLPGLGSTTASAFAAPLPLTQPQRQVPTAPRVNIAYSPSTKKFFVNNVVVDAQNALEIAEGAKFISAPAQPAPANVAQDWQPVTPQQYLATLDELKRPRGVLGNLRVGTQTTGESIVGGVGRVLETSGVAPEAGRALAGFAERTMGLSKEDQARSELIKQSNSLWSNILDATVQGVPFVLASLLAARVGVGLVPATASTGARTLGGIGGATAISFPAAVQSLYENAVKNKFDVNNPTVQNQILTAGLASAVLESLVPGGAVSSVLRQRAQEVAANAVSKQLSLASRARTVGGAVVTGGLEEAATEVGQTLIEQLTFDREFRKQLSAADFKAMVPYVVEKYGEDVAIAAGAGALLGGGIKGGARIIETSPRNLLEQPLAPTEEGQRALPAPTPLLGLPAPTPGAETTPTLPPVTPAAPAAPATPEVDERFVNTVTTKLTKIDKALPKAESGLLKELAARRKDIDPAALAALSEDERAALADPKAFGLNNVGLRDLLTRVRELQQYQVRSEVTELLSRGVPQNQVRLLNRDGIRRRLEELRTPPEAPPETVMTPPAPEPVLALPSPTGPGGIITMPPPPSVPSTPEAITPAAPVAPAPAARAVPAVSPETLADLKKQLTAAASPAPKEAALQRGRPTKPTADVTGTLADLRKRLTEPAAPVAPVVPVAPVAPAAPTRKPLVGTSRLSGKKLTLAERVNNLSDADQRKLAAAFGGKLKLINAIKEQSNAALERRIATVLSPEPTPPTPPSPPSTPPTPPTPPAAPPAAPAPTKSLKVKPKGAPRATEEGKQPEGRQPERAPVDEGRPTPEAGGRDRTEQGRKVEKEVAPTPPTAEPTPATPTPATPTPATPTPATIAPTLTDQERAASERRIQYRAEAEAFQNADPKDRVSVGSFGDVDPNTVGYVAALSKLVDIKNFRIVVVHVKDIGGLLSSGLTPKAITAAQQALSGNALAAMIKEGRNTIYSAERYFVIGDKLLALPPAKRLEILAHEIGHVVETDAFNRASPEIKKAVIQAYEAFLQRNQKEKVTIADVVRDTYPKSMQAEVLGNLGSVADVPLLSFPENNVAYLLSSAEWFANQVARWATTQSKPLSIVDRFFAGVAKLLRRLHKGYVDQADAEGLPSKAMKDFLDGLAANVKDGTVAIVGDAETQMGEAPTPDIQEARLLFDTKETISNYANQNVPQQLRESSKVIATNLYDLTMRGFYGLVFGRFLVERVSKMLPAARTYFDSMARVMADSNRLWQQANAIMASAMDIRGEARESLNKFLADSTIKQKWGYKPTWRPDADITVDPAMKKAYDSLTPQAKEIADAVFKHSYTSRQKLRTAVRNLIQGDLTTAEFNSLSSEMKRQRRDAAARRLKAFDTLVPELQGPYAPLSRFGNYVAVAKSAKFIEAEKEYAAAPTELNREALDNLRSSADDYAVSFAPSLGAAQKIADYFKRERGFDFTDHYGRMEFGTRELEKASWAGIQRLKSQLDTELRDAEIGDKAMLSRLNEFVQDMYIATLSESSARRHNLKRLGISGFDEDMLHSFAVKSRSESNFISAVKGSIATSDALADIRKQAKLDDTDIDEYNAAQPEGQQVTGTRADRTRAAKELMQRHTMGVAYQDTPIQDRMMTINAMWMLLLKPAYYVANGLQSYVMSLPVMAARFGYGNSARALTDAYGDIIKGIGSDGGDKLLKFWRGQLDLTTVKDQSGKPVFTKDEVAMLEFQRDNNLIDIGLGYDLGYWEAHSGTNPVSRLFQTTVHKLSTVNRQVELLNRVSSGLAAHRLYKSAPIRGMTSNEYVTSILADTQGDYSGLNAPRFFSSFQGSKVIFQFRKFQLMQATLLAKNTYEMFKGDSREEKVVAAKTLAFVLGQTAVLTGALGLPGVAAMTYILGLAFGDDNEPVDAERILRRAIGNDVVADIILKGAPAGFGIDMSGQLGMSTAFSIMPYTDLNLSSREDFAKTVLGLGGPTVGLATSTIDAMQFIKNGDYQKGIEALLPSGLKHAAKAYRETYAEGITRRNGDQVISPEEFNFMQSFAQALGFSTTKMQEIRRAQKDIFEFDKYFRERTTQIRRSYVDARKSNDFESMEQAKQDWQNLQAAKQRVNVKPSPLGNLYLAPPQQTKREKEYQERLRKIREEQ